MDFMTRFQDFQRSFQAAVRIPTWWPADALPGDSAAEAPLLRFQEFLVEQFPAFHRTAERWVLSPYAVVYRLPAGGGAANSSETAANNNAVLFLAHYDVVPAETEKWSVDPFGAELKDGFVYGRGTLDMKNTLISVMEAAETLCAAGFKPQRDIWFAFGGDEERAGILGAGETAKWFAGRGQHFSWILDEGTPIAENQIPGIDEPLALVSIEEKGFLSLDLRVSQKPGHSSRPPKTQAAAVLARALVKIAKKPFPCKLVPTVEHFFRRAGALRGGAQGFVMRHARLLGPLFFALTGSGAATAAMLRTTVAMTQLAGSVADNVLPSEVRAVLNLRLLQPWTVEKAGAFITKTINDTRVTVSVHGLGTDPVPANDCAGGERPGWKELASALEKSWPGIAMTEFIMLATTDSRHYKDLAGHIFRFSPYRLNPAEMAGIHGHDERVSEENLRRGLQFYTALLESL
jgi:carboxypeptidase PM20D1